MVEARLRHIGCLGTRVAQAEVLTRGVCDLALDAADRDLRRLKAATGERWWQPALTADDLASACRNLRDAARRWRALPAGDAIRVWWRLPPAK